MSVTYIERLCYSRIFAARNFGYDNSKIFFNLFQDAVGRVKRKRGFEHAQNVKNSHRPVHAQSTISTFAFFFIHLVVYNDTLKGTLKALIRLRRCAG